MKHRNLLIITLAFISICMSDMNAVNADISSWTDENGVRHYTNKKPPKRARDIKKTDEIEYDPVEDMKRQRGLEEYREKKYLKELNKDKTTPQITNESESEEKAGKKVLEETFQINEYEVNIAGHQRESWLVVSGEVSSKSECRLLSVRIGMTGENITLGAQLNKYIRVTLKDIDSSKPGIIDENVWVDNKDDQIRWTVSEINISCKER
ncbi:MAG: DUF4124 domain-containing protein [Desulfobacterales bacterium]|nr:DUF4124 domain-containing protein [Desulfobacterales bacterium]